MSEAKPKQSKPHLMSFSDGSAAESCCRRSNSSRKKDVLVIVVHDALPDGDRERVSLAGC